MRTDLLRVIEAAYRIDGDEAGWLRAVATEARGAVPGGPGAAAWTFRDGDASLRDGCVEVDASPAHLDGLLALTREVPALRASEPSGGLRAVAPVLVGARPPPAWRLLEGLGVRDVVVAWHAASDGRGVGLAWFQERRVRISEAQGARWGSVLRQVVGAHAMRLRVHGEQRVTGVAEAVAAVDTQREDRRAAALAADGVTGVGDEAASPAWLELLDGRLSVVDRFDAQGRRWLLATTARATWPPVRLGEVDGRILQLRAGGASMKVIASELRLSISSVSRRLERAMSAVAARTPSELAALLSTTSVSEVDLE